MAARASSREKIWVFSARVLGQERLLLNACDSYGFALFPHAYPPAMESCRRRVNSVYIVGIVGMLSTLLALVPVVSAEFDQCARPSGVWVGYDQVSACMT